MENRQIDHNTLYRVIEEGQIKERDEVHVWIYLNVPGRMDNLILPPPLWPMR
jgi:MOSC domain-containing protein YiiM